MNMQGTFTVLGFGYGEFENEQTKEITPWANLSILSDTVQDSQNFTGIRPAKMKANLNVCQKLESLFKSGEIQFPQQFDFIVNQTVKDNSVVLSVQDFA